MKTFPKILPVSEKDFGLDCICLDKLDGSNLRYSFDRKLKWHQFGTRHRMFDRQDPEFGQAIGIFLEKYSEPLERIFRDQYPKTESFIAFAEFVGPVSFAGIHDPVRLHEIGYLKEMVPNPRDVVLFDLNVHKKGFIDPFRFLELFSGLHIPRVVYEGVLDKKLVDSVRSGELPVFEGVICKGGKNHALWMRKIKTEKYLVELRRVFGTGWEDYWE